MRSSYSPMPFLIVALVPCCSSTTDSPGVSSVSQDAGYETNDCASWPQSKLFPLIGPFFGPVPGPCKMMRGGIEYYFLYNTSNVLTNLLDTDKTDITAYGYDQGLLATETRSQVSGVSTTTYEYTDDLVRTVTTSYDGIQTVYEYTLDDRGYVQLATLMNPVASVSLPTHYSYEYTNCRLHFRIAYDMNDAPNLDATAEYFYDDEGNMIRRTSIIADEQFDYSSCW
jgi:hypothetical protein